MANFENQEEYEAWCVHMVGSIYYANIAMNNERIKEVVVEIARRMWVTEGDHLVG